MTTNDPSVVHVGPCAVAPTNCYVWDESTVRTISGYDQVEDLAKFNFRKTHQLNHPYILDRNHQGVRMSTPFYLFQA